MTAQQPDILIHRGRRLDLYGAPLYRHLVRIPRARRPKFRSGTTANHRGYVAVWEIIDGQLYLTAIEDACVMVDGALQDATLQTVFPRGPYPVPAKWVSDELRCPEGRLRWYIHHGFASRFERDRVFWVQKGVVVEEWLVHNPPAPLYYLIAPDGSRTYAQDFTRLALAPDEDPFPGDGPVEPWRLWGNPDWDISPYDMPDDEVEAAPPLPAG
jgi:hypothetical protein